MNNTVKKILSGVSLVGAIIGGVALINRRLSQYARKYQPNVLIPSQYSWRFGRISYTKIGEGEPVVLVHSLEPGSSSILFEPLAMELSENHTVYLLDLPGYGLSDKPKMTYTSYFYVHMLSDFVEQVVGHPAYVIADASSCAFTAIACNSQPDLYQGLIFFNPPTAAEENMTPTWGLKILRSILEWPLLGTLVYNLSMTVGALRTRFGSNLDEGMLRRLSSAAHVHDITAHVPFASFITLYMNANFSLPLSKVDHNVYIMLSGDPDQAREQADYLNSVNSSVETEYIQASRKSCPWLTNTQSVLETCRIVLGDNE